MWMRWKRGPKTAPPADALPDAAPRRESPPPEEPKRHAGGLLPKTPPERLFTPEALQRAWLAIRRAGGGAGVDGVTIAGFERNREAELAALRDALVRGSYRPRPVRQVMVPKANGGLRPLAMWALRDRIAQRVHYDLLAPVFEPHFLPCSYGFRPGQGVQDAVAALAAHRDRNLRWVVDADIEECFDRIPTGRLMEVMRRRVRDPLVLRYVASWLNARLLNSADGVPRRAGASQGSALSPLLANIYLHEVDRVIAGRGLAYLRYADDFVVCCRRRSDAEEALAVCRDAMAAWGLAVNTRKTQVVHFDQGFAWLGYFFVRRECYRLAVESPVAGRPEQTAQRANSDIAGQEPRTDGSTKGDES